MSRTEPVDELADLFRPTLSATDDVARAKAPWDPSSLWMATFFGGGLAAALLFGLNARRLGVGRQALWLVPVLVVATLALAVVVYTYRDELGGETRVVNRVASVLVGAIGWSVQRRRFRTFVTAGGEAGKALLPAIGAILLSIALTFGFALVYVAVVGVEASAS